MFVSSAMLNALRRVLLGVATGSLLTASPTLADWEADIHTKPMKSRSGEPLMETKGKAYGRNNVMRLDMDTERGPMSTLIDKDKRTVVILLHDQKMAMQMEMEAGSPEVDFPSCHKQDFKTCLVQHGYKKTGSAKVNGHPSDIYEKEHLLKSGRSHIKAWVPTDIQEPMIVRSQTTDASGAMSETNLTNIKVTDQPDSLFTVPSDYRLMQRGDSTGAGAPGARPAPIDPSEFEGKTSEQFQEMIQRRYGQGEGAPREGTQ